MTRLPVAGVAPPAAPRPRTGNPPKERYWHFSLRYWRQIDQFGVGDKDGPWFIALLNRLTDLCRERMEDVLSSFEMRGALRIHDIDWTWRGIKTKLKDLDWIPERYLGNQDEYPLMQIQVSKANGRIVGFFDEDQLFNIVLLDPNHNLQPSAYSAYKIRPTKIGDDEISQVRVNLERAITERASLSPEDRSHLLEAVGRDTYGDEVVVVMRLNPEQVQSIQDCIVSCDVNDAGEFFVKCVEEYATR